MHKANKNYIHLSGTSFINEVFNISVNDDIGVISGFRLGRITNKKDKGDNVTWKEINTALGQTAYLLVIIAHKLGFDQK